MTPQVASALAWLSNERPGAIERPDALARARADLASAGVDPRQLLARIDRMLRPCGTVWLIDRIQAVWHSTTPTNSMTAEAYLGETGRLLEHLPTDIAAFAIDRAVIGSPRGFTPTAGAILAVAEPLLAQRRRERAAIERIASGRAPKPDDARASDGEPICAGNEARAILASLGIDTSGVERRRPDLPPERGPGRMPSREDYLRMGVDPAALDQTATGEPGGATVEEELAR